MPSRIIKESIVISDSLSNISAEAERFFWRLVVKADDFGLYYGDTRILASLCFPQKPPTEQKIRAWLNELIREGMVGTYTAAEDGKKYMKLLNWERCQQTRAKNSKYPEPVSFDSICNHRNGNQVIAKVPDNGNGNEFGNENRESSASAPDGFDRFWAAYPRKIGKQEALKAWRQLKPDPALVEKIIAGIEVWKASDLWKKDNGDFICYPQKFLRQRYWEEDPRSGGSGQSAPAKKDYGEDEDFLSGPRG